jgi:hypothetical protein
LSFIFDIFSFFIHPTFRDRNGGNSWKLTNTALSSYWNVLESRTQENCQKSGERFPKWELPFSDRSYGKVGISAARCPESMDTWCKPPMERARKTLVAQQPLIPDN